MNRKEREREREREHDRAYTTQDSNSCTLYLCDRPLGQPRAGGSTSHSRQVRITTSFYLISTYVYIHPRFPSPKLIHLKPRLLFGISLTKNAAALRSRGWSVETVTLGQVRKSSASRFFHNRCCIVHSRGSSWPWHDFETCPITRHPAPFLMPSRFT